MRIANDGARAAGRLCSIGFHPIFRIEGLADRLDPEDWIPATCGSGMPWFSRHTQPRGHDRELLLSIPIGFEKVFTIVWNDCSKSIGIAFTLARNAHPPSSGGFRSTVSLSARVGSADSHSSFGGLAAKRQGMPTVL